MFVIILWYFEIFVDLDDERYYKKMVKGINKWNLKFINFLSCKIGKWNWNSFKRGYRVFSVCGKRNVKGNFVNGVLCI